MTWTTIKMIYSNLFPDNFIVNKNSFHILVVCLSNPQWCAFSHSVIMFIIKHGFKDYDVRQWCIRMWRNTPEMAQNAGYCHGHSSKVSVGVTNKNWRWIPMRKMHRITGFSMHKSSYSTKKNCRHHYQLWESNAKEVASKGWIR